MTTYSHKTDLDMLHSSQQFPPLQLSPFSFLQIETPSHQIIAFLQQLVDKLSFDFEESIPFTFVKAKWEPSEFVTSTARNHRLSEKDKIKEVQKQRKKNNFKEIVNEFFSLMFELSFRLLSCLPSVTTKIKIWLCCGNIRIYTTINFHDMQINHQISTFEQKTQTWGAKFSMKGRKFFKWTAIDFLKNANIICQRLIHKLDTQVNQLFPYSWITKEFTIVTQLY